MLKIIEQFPDPNLDQTTQKLVLSLTCQFKKVELIFSTFWVIQFTNGQTIWNEHNPPW